MKTAEDYRKLGDWIRENAGLEAKSLPIAIRILWMMDRERWEAYQREHTPNSLEEGLELILSYLEAAITTTAAQVAGPPAEEYLLSSSLPAEGKCLLSPSPPTVEYLLSPSPPAEEECLLSPCPPAEEECLLVLPPQPKWEEPECPQPKREQPKRPTPEWEEPERPTPKWEEPERPTPEWEEPKRPTPEWEEPERPTPEWEEPERPTPEWEEPERPTPEWEEPERPTSIYFGLKCRALCFVCTTFLFSVYLLNAERKHSLSFTKLHLSVYSFSGLTPPTPAVFVTVPAAEGECLLSPSPPAEGKYLLSPSPPAEEECLLVSPSKAEPHQSPAREAEPHQSPTREASYYDITEPVYIEVRNSNNSHSKASILRV
ncbi:UNVERIFIED_CONTAM: hypothetical protein FKN15_050149 [Acipenser sinensis]